MISILLLASRGQEEDGHGHGLAVGATVGTSFGTFTVTRVSTTFVPDTQGPPSQAQHLGTRSTDQLQVWLRLVHDGGDEPLAYSPDQFRLLDGSAATARRPDGSTLQPAVLAKGSSIDGQVWFDLARTSSPTEQRWLEYVDPGGHPIGIAAGVTHG